MANRTPSAAQGRRRWSRAWRIFMWSLAGLTFLEALTDRERQEQLADGYAQLRRDREARSAANECPKYGGAICKDEAWALCECYPGTKSKQEARSAATTASRAAVTEREMELVCQREDLRQALADALAEIEELRGRLKLACEPCAECGHIDWRELDDILETA